jgi:hypothetical protein
METKVCSKCNIEKELVEFNKQKQGKYGVRGHCRECQRKETKKYKFNNKKKIAEYNKKWNYQNKKYYQEYRKIWENKNPDKLQYKRENFKKNNPNYYNEYQIKRKKEDILFHLKCKMRDSVNRYLKYRSTTTSEIVGCSPQELKEHLENKFVPGMSWENRAEWHIDHIIPLSSAKTEEELYKLCHYTNLQPLWAEENLKKSNKLLN